MPKISDKVWSLQYLPCGHHDQWLAVDDIRPTADPATIVDDAQLAADDLGAAVRIMLNDRQAGPVTWPRRRGAYHYPTVIVGCDYVQLGVPARLVPRWLRVVSYTPYGDRARVGTVLSPERQRGFDRPTTTNRHRDIQVADLHTLAVTKHGRPRTTGYVRVDGWTVTR